MIAPVLRPSLFGVRRIEWPLLAVADGADARRVDAEGHQVVLRRLRAAVAEGQVVLLGAALVAVAFDQKVVLRILFQPVGRRCQRRLGASLDPNSYCGSTAANPP